MNLKPTPRSQFMPVCGLAHNKVLREHSPSLILASFQAASYHYSYWECNEMHVILGI